MKQCVKCKKLKLESKFNKKTKSLDGLQLYCRACQKKTQKQWHKENPSHALLKSYGITIEEKHAMNRSQHNSCAICRETFSSTKHTHVDHCHDTKKIRGILCISCNHGIGKFKDSPKLLQRAIHYIEYHAKTKSTTPVSAGPNREGEVSAEHGTIPTTGAWQDYDDLDDYRGATQGQNSYRSAKEGR